MSNFNTTPHIEVCALADKLAKRIGKTRDEIDDALRDTYLMPEGDMTHYSRDVLEDMEDEYTWLGEELNKMLDEDGVDEVMIYFDN